MEYIIIDNLVKVTIGLSLITTSGVLLIAILKVLEKVFDLGLQMFNMKKEFFDFIIKKYRDKRGVTKKIQQNTQVYEVINNYLTHCVKLML